MFNELINAIFNGFKVLVVNNFNDIVSVRLGNDIIGEVIFIFTYLEEEGKTQVTSSYLKRVKYKFQPDCKVETILNFLTKEVIEENNKREIEKMKNLFGE